MCAHFERVTVPFVRLLLVAFIFATSLQGTQCDISEQDKLTILKDINHAEKYVKTDAHLECLEIIKKIMGPEHEDGSVDTEGLYTRFIQAYHYNFPATPVWKEARAALQQARKTSTLTRNMLHDWKELEEYPRKCQELIVKAEKSQAFDSGHQGAASLELTNGIKYCRDNRLISEIRSDAFAKRLWTATYRSIHELTDALYNSVANLFYNEKMAKYQWSVFKNMHAEVKRWDNETNKRLTETFPDYIAKVRDSGSIEEADELNERLNEIQERLANDSLPYPVLYFYGNGGSLDEYTYDQYEDPDTTTLLNFAKSIDALLEDEDIFTDNKPYYLDGGKYNHHLAFWKKNITTFQSDLIDKSVEKFMEALESRYTNFVNVSYKKQPSINDDGVVENDGEWDWDIENNGLHVLRLAWDLMGGVLEEIKCYMKDTYYFHLRDEALQRTQVNLTNAVLYTNISETMQFPCRIEDDLDLVSPYCNAKNHEICAPMGPLDPRQRTDSGHHGGRTLLRPKWVYKYDETKKRCVGRKDYVMKYYACRCGFRLDCGKDLGVNITCQLQHNSNGQCRGGVGYPCKTLPLEPEKHHETCKSGYCNMNKNSCEDRPYILEKSRGNPTWRKGKFTTPFLIYLGGLAGQIGRLT